MNPDSRELAPHAQAAISRLRGFARRLRESGLSLTTSEMLGAIEGLRALDLADDDALYWGLRTSMIHSVEELPIFDAVFREYWGDATDVDALEDCEGPGRPRDADEDRKSRSSTNSGAQKGMTRSRSAVGSEASTDDEEASFQPTYSAREVLRDKDFAAYDEQDYRGLMALLEQTRFDGPWRTNRRARPHRRGRADMRRTIRAGLRTSGYPMQVLRRRSGRKLRRVAFACDVSGSMERYSRAVLALALAAARKRGKVEAFAFATRLTRVTEELARPEPMTALTAAVGEILDWSGGTRVGSCLEQLNREYSAMVSGAVVIVASDGWDLGDPKQLANEARALQLKAHRVIWLNPRLRDPKFEPLTVGMSAALPFVDELVSCHNFDSFSELAETLRTL